MKYILIFLPLITAWGFQLVKAQNLQWIKVLENKRDLAIYHCATNNHGELALWGEADDSINIGGLTNPVWKVPPSSSASTFMVTYDSLGGVKWFQWMGFEHSTSIRVNSIVLDDSACLYISGSFLGTYDIDPGIGIDTIRSTRHDRFVAKYANEGTLQWKYQTFTMPSEPNSIGASAEILVSPLGEVYMLTSLYNEMDLDPSPDTAMVRSSIDMRAFFVLKLGIGGDYQGHVLFDFSAWTNGIAATTFCLNSSGTSIFLGGEFTGTPDLDPGPGIQLETAVGGNSDMFFSKFLTSSMSYQWHKVLSGNGSGSIRSIQVDGDENIYISGRNNNEIDFDPGTAVDTLQTSGITGFLARYGASGEVLYVKKCKEESPQIFVDNIASIWMSEEFSGTVDVEPGPAVVNATSTGGMDWIVHRHDSAGNLTWQGQITGSNDELLEAQTVSKSQVYFGVGSSASTDNDINPTTGFYNMPLALTGKSWFIFKLAPWSLPTVNPAANVFDSWRIFPNPATNLWNLSGEQPVSGKYELFDVTGRVISTQQLKSSFGFQVDCTGYAKGVYFLKLQSENGFSGIFNLLHN